MTTYRERLKAGHHDANKIEAKEDKATNIKAQPKPKNAKS